MTSSRDVIRSLAAQLAGIAVSDEQAFRRRLWCDVNSLRIPQRPPCICHPNCWEELLPRADCVSEDPFERGVEYTLRQMLYKIEIGDDTVVQPWWTVTAVLELQGEHLWGFPIGYAHSGVAGGAWRYEPPLKEEADLDRIEMPVYRYNAQATQEAVERHRDLLGDALPIRISCDVPTPGVWFHGWATQLRGVQQLLEDIMDRPEWVHRLMRLLADGYSGIMTQLEEQGCLTLNNLGTMACDDLPQPDFDGEHVRLKDMWGRGESQEFQGVSPAQHEQFLLAYQRPVLARWGLSYYGCCEDLTSKIPLILSIPNLRKFVCSPWTNLERLVEAIGDRYCIEWRQKATDVAFSPTMQPMRKHLTRGLRIARSTPIQIVLQELETVDHNPNRLREWAAAAKQIGAELGSA